MHLATELSHCSHVYYVVAIANTAVIKSLNFKGESLALQAFTGRLWQPRAMQLPIGQRD